MLLQWIFAMGNTLKLPIEGVNVEQVGSTDSTPFRDRKIPTITLHSITQETLGILHTAKDTFEALDLNVHYDTYRLLTAYLIFLDMKLGQAPLSSEAAAMVPEWSLSKSLKSRPSDTS